MINFATINTFEGGHSKDSAQNVEKKNTFTKGINGRIYSKDGVYSFSSIEGSKLVYQNSSIVKYLGFHSFSDETLVFAKCLKPTGSGEGSEEQITEIVVHSESSIIQADADAGIILQNTGNIISANSSLIESTYTVINPVTDPTDFEIPYSEVSNNLDEIDFGEYYKERFNVANFSICDINNNNVPINNQDYYDTIISFTLDNNGILKGERIWTGAQNWPFNGKITTEGVEENEFYKRVYYTDAVNPRRVFNRKDTSLSKRKSKEFSQILNNVLLQPEIKSIEDGGQCKAMKSLYIYRIISENGQVSGFSPFSEFAIVLPEDEPVKFRGGDIGEITGKMVKVKCNLLEVEESAQIECIALEFETLGPPTAIRNLGVKPARNIVEFEHFGNETELIDDITINDVLEFKNSWTYCNDFTSKKNKLIAAGLRNSPIPAAIENLDYLFPLHSWNAEGETHNSLMNPEPWNYRYVDPTNTAKLTYVRNKKYTQIASFGPLTISLKNKLVGLSLDLRISNLALENYSSILPEVTQWILEQQSNNSDFSILFPNLKITDNDGQLLFSAIDSSIQTDLSNYIFESNNEQFIENIKTDLVFLNPPVDTSKLVYGAQSAGFNEGNGVRVTFREVKEPLLNQAASRYEGSGNVLDFHTPSFEKYVMRGEIYRLAFQAYDLKSDRYFAIPLGDIQVPETNEMMKEIDDEGKPRFPWAIYQHQSVEDGILYGHGIKMHIEVRLSCELQDLISMYQLLYVERTEDNRTILCQGIAAPLQRVQTDFKDDNKMPESLQNKWTLPYYGGPVYEKAGLLSYDSLGENHIDDTNSIENRVMTNRRLFTFDSPDLYFSKISDQYLKSSKAFVVGIMSTDHTIGAIMGRGKATKIVTDEAGIDWGGWNFDTDYETRGIPEEEYPKFSRKILEEQLEGNIHVEGLPKNGNEDFDGQGPTLDSYFINVSVFANFDIANVGYTRGERTFDISKSEVLHRGEIISGAAFDLEHDVSNNAIAMPSMPWYFSRHARAWSYDGGRPKVTMFKSAMTSPGYSTAIIKTDRDLFDDHVVGADIQYVNSDINFGRGNHVVYDRYPLINIYRNNRESVYGGRSKQAYSKNTYIPLSKTIPVSKNSGVQSFDVGADTYITLNIRTKNDAGDDEVEKITFNNGHNGRDAGDVETWKRNGAWNYAVVLETQVEPKLSYGHEFYRRTGKFNFETQRSELINSAYFNKVDMKQFIPKPFQFKDDPDLGNVIAVSDVKLAGELYDSWTMFKPNNFYAELEKNKGDVSNILRWKDQVFAVQEDQTSLIHIGTDRIINDAQGNPVNIKQGSGQVVEGHQVLSSYGTAIRRAIALSDFGFTFFDEKHIELVKIDKPMLIKNLLHHDYWERLKNDRIIDCEAYYDHANKESNIRIRTAGGQSFVISYNELFQVLNGEYEYNNDLYIDFSKKIYAPAANGLHQLNEGDPLNLFGTQKLMKVETVVHSNINSVFLYKQLGLITNLKYPIRSAKFKTSLGQERTILGNHKAYKIREGNHSLPAKNEIYTPEEKADLRGNWVSVEITAESLHKNKVDILAVLNNLRQSHQ